MVKSARSGSGGLQEYASQETWPDSPGFTWDGTAGLRSILSMMMANAAPMILFWGADGIIFSNEAAGPWLAGSASAAGRMRLRDLTPPPLGIGPGELAQVLDGRSISLRRENPAAPGGTIEIACSPVFGDGEAPAGMLAMIRPENTRNRLPSKAEVDFKAIFTAAAVGLSELTPDGRFLSVNDHLCHLFGYSRDQLLRMTANDVTHPADLALSIAAYESVGATGEPASFDKRYIRADGREIWANSSLTRIADPAGASYRLLAVTVDLTARQRAEATLRESEARFRSLVSQATIGILEADAQGHCIYVNDSYCQMLGRDRPELLGMPIMDFAFSLNLPRNKQAFTDFTRSGPVVQEKRLVRKDGGTLWVLNSLTPILGPHGETEGAMLTCVDITARRHAEAALAAELTSMTRLHEMSMVLTGSQDLPVLLDTILHSVMELQHAPMGEVRLRDDRTGRLQVVAQRGIALQAPAGGDADLAWNDAAAAALRLGSRIIIEDVETSQQHAPLRSTAAHNGFQAAQATPLFDRAGMPLGVLSTFFRLPHRPSHRDMRLTDLYARQAAEIVAGKLADQALRESEERLRFALDAVHMGTWSWDVLREVPTYDTRAREILGLAPDCQLLAGPLRRHIHPEDHERLREVMSRVFDPSGPGRSSCEFRWIRPDGVTIWIALSGQGRFEGTGAERRPAMISGTMLDITERKRSEEQQQLLTREVDHRAKNMLGTIQAMVTLSARSHETVGEFVAAIQNRIHALAHVHELLAGSRWYGMDLRQLFMQELAPYATGRPGAAELLGEVIVLRPPAAMAVTMVVHELVTNAAKYGALSTPEGKIRLHWRRLTDGSLAIDWAEIGGPPVSPPRRRGFGSQLIERSLRGGVGGDARLCFDPAGVRCSIRIPGSQITDPPRPGQPQPVPRH